MGGGVVLAGEVGQVLLAGGEHHAVDLGVGPLPGQGDLLVDLRQPGAEAADGPLDRGIGADQGPLAAEVPGRGVPVLEVDEPELRPPADEQLDRPGVQGRGVAPADAGGLADEGGLGPLLEHDQRVVEVDPPRRRPGRPG